MWGKRPTRPIGAYFRGGLIIQSLQYAVLSDFSDFCRSHYFCYFWTLWIFNFCGLSRIGYGYIDFFLIRIKDLSGFLNGPWAPKNFYWNFGCLKICINP